MRATIDAGGRVVVPKAVRERLGLTPGAEVELVERDAVLEIAPVATPMTLVEFEGVHVAQAQREMPTLRADAVREVLEQTRR